MALNLPKVDYGLIGGSGTWGIRFPEDLHLQDVRLVDVIPSVDTPFGKTAPYKLIDISGTRVLRVATHGWTKDENGQDLPIWVTAEQAAWVFAQAGVKHVIADGSVGGIKNPEKPSESLEPWSVVVPDDFILHWSPPIRPTYRPNKPKVRLGNPFCKSLRTCLIKAAEQEKRFHVFSRGVYVTAPSYRFETEAEIRMMSDWGANVVGETLGFEAMFLRDAGIHFAALDIVANVAEGFVTWMGESSQSLADFYHACALPVGQTMVRAAKAMIAGDSRSCDCDVYRLENLESFPVRGA